LISSIYNILLLESRLASAHPEFFTGRADLEAMYNLCLILYIMLHKFVININVTKLFFLQLHLCTRKWNCMFHELFTSFKSQGLILLFF